jgi:hypothetical protein
MSIEMDAEIHTKLVSHMTTAGNNWLAAWGYQKADKSLPHTNGYGGCHGGVMNEFTKGSVPFKWFGSTTSYAKTNYNETLWGYIQEYLTWIFGPESPWRSVHNNDIELVKWDNGGIKSFILGSDAFADKPHYGSIFNLLIAARMTRDGSYVIQNYGDLKKLGLDDLQAYVLAPYFCIKSGVWTRTATVWDAAHKPLRENAILNSTDSNYRQLPKDEWTYKDILSPRRLRESDFNYTIGLANASSRGWCDHYPKGVNEKETLSYQIRTEGSIKTRFSTLKTIDPEKIKELAKARI